MIFIILLLLNIGICLPYLRFIHAAAMIVLRVLTPSTLAVYLCTGGSSKLRQCPCELKAKSTYHKTSDSMHLCFIMKKINACWKRTTCLKQTNTKGGFGREIKIKQQILTIKRCSTNVAIFVDTSLCIASQRNEKKFSNVRHIRNSRRCREPPSRDNS